ncbi:complement factor H-related protein 2-like [Lampris incognitus]|uniref:complement factor H-related protein 2-like n=1 Tax=Lampris incognitus TaxID=2546036 RepID=UPI0024B4874F|nr:complement factor H-related protein 2-like [Lampris incognitus]
MQLYFALLVFTLWVNIDVSLSQDGKKTFFYHLSGEPINCGAPPHLENGDILGSLKKQYNHGERVEYACKRFYTISGLTYKSCMNGQWTGESKCLKPCTMEMVMMTTNNIAFKYVNTDKLYLSHNDATEFACTAATRPDGTLAMRQACVDGVILLPRCQ